jgi:hypothetical protein
MLVKFRIFELKEIWVDGDLVTCFEDWGQEFDHKSEALYFIKTKVTGAKELTIKKILTI